MPCWMPCLRTVVMRAATAGYSKYLLHTLFRITKPGMTFDDLGGARPGPIRLRRAVAEVALVQPRPAPHVASQRRQQNAGKGGGVAHLLPGEGVEPTCPARVRTRDSWSLSAA